MGGGNRTSTNRNRKLTTGLPAAAAAAAAVTAVMSFLDQEAEGRKDIPELPESLAAGEACCAEFVASSLPLMCSCLPSSFPSVVGVSCPSQALALTCGQTQPPRADPQPGCFLEKKGESEDSATLPGAMFTLSS